MSKYHVYLYRRGSRHSGRCFCKCHPFSLKFLVSLFLTADTLRYSCNVFSYSESFVGWSPIQSLSFLIARLPEAAWFQVVLLFSEIILQVLAHFSNDDVMVEGMILLYSNIFRIVSFCLSVHAESPTSAHLAHF